MNKQILTGALVIGLSSSAFAAIKKPSSVSLTGATEVLALPSENRRVIVQEQGDKYYPTFIQIAFNDAQPMSIRWKALMAAAEAQGEGATKDLLKAGDHEQWFMRNAALIALKEVNPSQSQKLAQKLLKDKALVVRSAAVTVLEGSITPEVRDLLWDELNQSYNFKGSQSLWIRHQIVEVLAKKPLDRELKIFADLLSDKDARVHVPAISGLEKLTGVQLGESKMKQKELVGAWKDYLKKEKVTL